MKIRFSLYFFLLLFIFLSASYFGFGTYKIKSDGKYYYQYLVSGFYDGDFDFTNNYTAPKYEWMKHEIDHYKMRNEVSLITGKPTNVFTIGPAVLWLPSFIMTYVSSSFLNMVGVHIDTNPWGKYFQYSVMYSAVIYAVLALYLLYRLLAYYFPDKASKSTVWLLLTSTNLFFYAVFAPSMSHVYDLLTYVAYLYLFIKSAKNRRMVDYLGLAVVGGLHVLVRTQNIVTILLFSFLLVIREFSKRESRRFVVVTYSIALLISLMPLPLTNMYLFGNPFTIPQGGGFLNITQPEVIGVLFSLRNGLFSTHPTLLLGAVGFGGFLLYVFHKKEKQELLFFVTMFIAFAFQVYVNSITRDWYAGFAFGQRRLISSFPLFAFGMAYLIQKAQTSHPKMITALIIFISVLGLYLTWIFTRIGIQIWNHNILAWMFYYAPKAIIEYILSSRHAQQIIKLFRLMR